jgi:hypothetical protein
MSSGRRRPERSDGITVFTVAVARNGQPIQNRPSRSLERIVHQEPRRSHVTIFPSQPNQPPQIPARRRRRHCGHVTAPTVVSAQVPINMRWHSTWPSKDLFHECALDYAKNRSARSSTRSNCGRMYGGDERQES